MVFSVRPAALLGLGLLMTAPFAAAQNPAPAHHITVILSLLPSTFAKWSQSAPAQTGNDPAGADAANASILKEYGLKDFAIAGYAHGTGNLNSGKLNIRAMRFVDATGAYGAFTFYRGPEMRPADIGKDAGVDSHEAIFWAGTTVIDATADHLGAEERSALKTLATMLPQNPGPEGVAPPLPKYLPAEALEKSTVRYAIGPEAYLKAGGSLPAEIIDFSRDAEVVTAKYPSHGGEGTLTIISYPTPQMAGDRARAIEAMLKGTPLPAGLQSSSATALAVKRSGPLVAVTSGAMTADESSKLLDQVKYEVAVTVNHPEGYVSEVKKTARLLLGIVYLTAILGGAAVFLGIFFGGGRALIRVMRGKPPSTLNDEDFISLKLGR
jgi:hypothetical protein